MFGEPAECLGDEAGGDLCVIGAGKAVVAAAVVEGELVVFQAH